jgi:hypothetical protein
MIAADDAVLTVQSRLAGAWQAMSTEPDENYGVLPRYLKFRTFSYSRGFPVAPPTSPSHSGPTIPTLGLLADASLHKIAHP